MSVESSALNVEHSTPHGAVFLSYASQDAEAAKRICEALRAAGVEVWFDQSELVGGDAWDAKIRKQIKECALFVPIISANTQARREGYFRLEWRLAVERMQHMDDDLPFLLPVVIDDTKDTGAFVPDKFRAVQWTRLSVKDTPETLAARVGKLLAGTSGQSEAAGSGGSASQSSGAPRRAGKSNSWVRVVVPIAGMLFGLIFAFRAVWSPAKYTEAKPGVVASPTAPSVSEAQKLVQQAQTVYAKGDQLDRETLVLADDLVKRALVLDPAEPSAWELAARLSYFMVWQSFDTSEARKADLQRQAARARALAPESVSAQLAVVNAQLALAFANFQSASNRQTMEALERDLLVMAERAPHDYQVQQALGQTYRFLRKPDEALRAMQRSLELSGGDPGVSADVINVLLRRKRYAEAEAMVAPALARRPIGRILGLDVMFKTIWRGDLPAAQAALTAWPGWLLREDRGAFAAWQTWLWSGRPDLALDVASRLPRDYLRDNWFTGPRAVLTARAHELAGHQEAAQADWRIVVRLADRELTGALEDDAPALFWKAWAQSRLGDQAGALAITALLQQRNLNSAVFFRTTSFALLWSTLGRTDLAAEHLRANANAVDDAYAVTRKMLELDPAYAPLRADPQFAALAAAALAPSPTSLPLTPSGPPAADQKSVAVLAFANLSDDKGNEYFSDGISEELLNVLAKVSGLIVRGRSSGFYFKGKQTRSAEIGQQLAVNYLVQGSVRRAGDRVRITAQLIRAATDEVLWSSGALDRDLKDIFAVQDEIARLIAQNLELKLGDGRTSVKVVNPEAHRLVLEGRHYLALRGEANFARGEAAFRAAAEIAPDMAVAHAGWAELAAQRGRYQQMAGLAAPGSQMEEVERHAARALQLDPSLSEPHAALAVALFDAGRLGEAEVAMARGIEANPNYSSQYLWRSHLHTARGRLDLALVDLQRATDLDPLAFIHLYIRGAHLGYAGRWTEALPLLDRGALLRGEHFLPLEGERAMARFLTGRREGAMALARKILADPELFSLGWWTMGEALWVLRMGGAEEEAVRQGGAILAKLSPDNYLRGYVLCCLGRFEEGLPLLRDIPTIARNRFYFVPIFDPARETSAFKRLISEMKVEKEYALARANLARLKQEAKQ